MSVLYVKMENKPVPITTKIVISNLVHGDVYSIQHYMIMFVSDLWQIIGFFSGTQVSSTNKIDRNDITEILLKVTLNTIYLKPYIHQVSLAPIVLFGGKILLE